jgi:DNA-binding NarL/FixJ family response regulator
MLGRQDDGGEGTQVDRYASTPGNGPDFSDPLSAIIADDDPLLRRTIKDALHAAGIVVIAEASTGREAVDLALQHRPDAVLMDIMMPQLDGISATRRILAGAPTQSIILFTDSEDEDMALLGLRVGAAGLLTKDLPVESLPRALRAAARGEMIVSRRLTARLVEYLRSVPERQPGG